MNKLKTMVIGILFLFGTTAWAHDGKATLVMEEMIKFHEALVKETSGKLDTKKLTELLAKGADDKKDTETFKKAIPLTEKLGKAETLKDKLSAYSLLVNELSSVVGHHDKSKANLFYCPMEKKKWIAKGDSIVNPYLKDMRDCGEKL
ncbi:MAG: DUF3347 domain-containing protein [Leptospiraceae bacterium]|jgi:hypothetical protein|nr:DUF3347 domain-containing protein [Leptospiraceae bacterium]